MTTVHLELSELFQAIDDEISEVQKRSEARHPEDAYTREDADRDIAMWQGEAKKGFETLTAAIKHAADALSNWGGSAITVKGLVDRNGSQINWDADEPHISINAEVFVHPGGAWKGQPSFTVFATQHGELRHIDDVLDAGDSDFFKDPATEADYFSLTEELRHPGRARAQGNKVVLLYTARPQKDRHVYERATQIPVNVFLTTDADEAWGYSRDLGGDRDIYQVRIKRMYLVETLDAGRVKNYQTFAGHGTHVPVEDIELIREGDARRVLARWSFRIPRNA